MYPKVILKSTSELIGVRNAKIRNSRIERSPERTA